jgi:hypothetical protein
MRSKANVSHISNAYQGCDYRRAIVIADESSYAPRSSGVRGGFLKPATPDAARRALCRYVPCLSSLVRLPSVSKPLAALPDHVVAPLLRAGRQIKMELHPELLFRERVVG